MLVDYWNEASEAETGASVAANVSPHTGEMDMVDDVVKMLPTMVTLAVMSAALGFIANSMRGTSR